jgi:predicted deacylase
MSPDAGIGAVPRVLGTRGGEEPGPLLLVVGGIHGNEPAGIEAARRVLAQLERRRPRLRGRLVACAGNLGALARDVRFLGRDLNRLWSEPELAALEAGSRDCPERDEQRELRAVLEREIAGARGPVHLLDLHSTSGGGAPFTIFEEAPGSRALAQALGVPSITGLRKAIAGTLIDALAHPGHAALVLEGGQSREPSTVDHHESALWLAMEAAGMGAPLPPGELAAHRARLSAAVAGLPDDVEVFLRYHIEAGETFRMEPGFSNLQRVHRGQVLARTGPDGGHEIRCPADAVLLMPLYQSQGQDGFFLARETHRRSRRAARA